MLKKVLIGLASFIMSSVIVSLIPLESMIKNQTVSDVMIVVLTIFITVPVYKLISSRLIKRIKH